MKKPILKGITCVAVFFITLIIISIITNKGNTDMTMEMAPASYPLVYVELNGERMNCLHGYARKMQESYMRDSITPMGEDRVVTLAIDKYKREITGLSFEVRSVDGSRLVEETPIQKYTDKDDTIRASITLKDLIDKNEEYSLIILLQLKDGETIRYYTRVIQTEDSHVNEKIAFVKDFHEKTFQKEESIAVYLETNAEGDNTSYHYVDIHSNFNQITWGDLNPTEISPPSVTLRELGTQTASISVDSYVQKDEETYHVKEFYRVRYSADRMYLLDYTRTMNQVFSASNKVFANNKIILGIADPGMEIKESDDGNIIAFCQENSLYSYNATDNKCASLFSFYNSENDDVRDIYDQHDIKVLSVEESGNIRFMVYGYMNRGRHEGCVGIQLYYYNSVLNTIEEDAFIEYDKSYALLQEEMEQLAYVSKSSEFYFILNGTFYSVNLDQKTSSIIAANLGEDTVKVSRNNEMIVWQTEQEKYNSTKLVLMNLNTKKQTDINAPAATRIAPLGFMNSDLIYGVADKGDIVKDTSGMITFPMKEVIIQSESGEVRKSYKQDNIYVVDGEIEDNLLNMKRVKKTGTAVEADEEVDKNMEAVAENTVSGNEAVDESLDIQFSSSQYEAVADDQIMNNVEEIAARNKVETAATENYEKIVQIALVSTIPTRSIKYQTPKEVLFEGGREILLEENKDAVARYYVYGKNGIEQISTKPASAINLASGISGVVLNDSGQYVWKKGNLATKNQIMKIREPETADKDSTSVCLDTILSYEGVNRNSQYLLDSGKTVYSVLEENLPDDEILMLNGCSLESILYYVNQDIPVLAMLDDGNAVLIIGFNELNTVIMNPQTGTIYKMGMNDSAKWFEENGNSFITYIRQD
ncbi:MAG: hypothetical protein PHE02_02280 [Lachnospiraceae bacterium]|nr:hypothetical protein [Lachnospiraceae bacterium]